MIRITTDKLINIVMDEYIPIVGVPHVNTSESILDQSYKTISYITDNFNVLRMQTVKHSWLSKEEHAKKILCQIIKSDYELISFKKKQLDDKLSDREFLPF